MQDEGILWGSISIITELIGEILRLTQDQIGLLRSKLGFKLKRNRLQEEQYENEREENEYGSNGYERKGEDVEKESYVVDADFVFYFRKSHKRHEL